MRKIVLTFLIPTIGTLGACSSSGGPPDEEQTSTTDDALMGSFTGDSTCHAATMEQAQKAAYFGRTLSASAAVRTCITHALSKKVHWGTFPNGHGGVTVGPYKACSTDPATSASVVLNAIQSPNDVRFSCDYTQPNGSTGARAPIGVHDSLNREAMLLVNRANRFDNTNRGCWEPGTGPCFDDTAYGEFAATIWHEALHVQGWTHMEYGSTVREFDCGLTQEPETYYGYSINYIVDECMRGVVEWSVAKCGGEIVRPNGLQLIDGFDANDNPSSTCTYVRDPNAPVAAPQRPSQARDGRIAALSRASGTMEVFWISANGAVMHSFWYEGGSWAAPSEIAPPGSASVNGHITAVSRTDKTMEIFWVGPDGSVQDAFWYEGAANWGRLNPPIAPAGSASTDGGIAALSRLSTHMELWYIGADGSVKDSFWNEGGNWSSYEIAPAGSASVHGSIAGVSRIPTSMEIWYTGANGSVQDRFWYAGDPHHWGFSELAPAGSASLYGSISAVSRIPGSMEVQFIGANGSVQDRFWYEGGPPQWGFSELAPAGSASLRGGLSVVSRVPTSLELWYVGANGSVQSKYWYEGSTGWAGAERAPAGSARTTQSVTALSRLPKAMEFWYGGDDGSLRDKFWYEGGDWANGPIIAPAGSLP